MFYDSTRNLYQFSAWETRIPNCLCSDVCASVITAVKHADAAGHKRNYEAIIFHF